MNLDRVVAVNCYIQQMRPSARAFPGRITTARYRPIRTRLGVRAPKGVVGDEHTRPCSIDQKSPPRTRSLLLKDTMGLDNASIKFACAAKSLGVDFSNSLMVGRQSLLPDASVLKEVFAIHGINLEAEAFLRANKYGETFFSLLGAREVNSMDYSSYEGATILHDMNCPIPAGLNQRFSVVYDGGTIEHVFNIPQALKNCMEMVQIGGHFLQANIANNYMGHGFWQFSPELLFRVLSPANGYEVKVVLLHEVVSKGAWYVVSDPDQVHQRVELCNSVPTYILTIAKRIAQRDIFSPPPFQSDYSAIWNRASPPQSQSSSNVNRVSVKAVQKSRLRRYLQEPVKRPLKVIYHRALAVKAAFTGTSPFDRSYYRRISERRLLRGMLE